MYQALLSAELCTRNHEMGQMGKEGFLCWDPGNQQLRLTADPHSEGEKAEATKRN